jgi:hypothetical protein
LKRQIVAAEVHRKDQYFRMVCLFGKPRKLRRHRIERAKLMELFLLHKIADYASTDFFLMQFKEEKFTGPLEDPNKSVGGIVFMGTHA